MPTSSCRAAEGCRRRLLSSSCTPSLRRLSSSCRAAEACSPEYVTHVPDLANTTQDVPCDVLYVVGGLYGNVAALEALEAGVRCEAEAGLRVEDCCNGDFNFFNATTETWARVNDGVRRLGRATAGNVERETLNSESTGCGCAYPEYVDAQFADRAAIIVDELRHVNSDPDIATWLAALPLYRTYVVRGTRVVCVHGDPACANGWALAAEHLPGGSRPEYATDDALVEGWFETANADVFASAKGCTARTSVVCASRPWPWRLTSTRRWARSTRCGPRARPRPSRTASAWSRAIKIGVRGTPTGVVIICDTVYARAATSAWSRAIKIGVRGTPTEYNALCGYLRAAARSCKWSNSSSSPTDVWSSVSKSTSSSSS